MHGTNKLECLYLSKPLKPSVLKHLLIGPIHQLQRKKTKKYCEFNSRSVITKRHFLFSSSLTNGPIKLECLYLKSLSSLINETLAYWTHSSVTKSVVNMFQGSVITKLNFIFFLQMGPIS